MKICKKCKIEKADSEFRKNSGSKDGLSSSCKKCLSDEERKKRYINRNGSLEGFEEWVKFYDNRGTPLNINGVESKTCRKCGKTKKLSEFVKDNRSASGYSNLCKECKKNESNSNYEKIKDDPNFHNKKLIANRKYKELNREKVENAWMEYNNRPEVKLKHHENYIKYYKNMSKEDRVKELVRRAKKRAKDKSLPFDVDAKDLLIVDICPILNIPLNWNGGPRTDNTPSLDKINPELGYIKSNCRIISNLANMMKSSATKEQLLNFSINITNYINKDIVRTTENGESVELENKESLG